VTLQEYVADRLSKAEVYERHAAAADAIGRLLPAARTAFEYRLRAVFLRDQAAACRADAAEHAAMLHVAKWWEG